MVGSPKKILIVFFYFLNETVFYFLKPSKIEGYQTSTFRRQNLWYNFEGYNLLNSGHDFRGLFLTKNVNYF
jgi:hypothetical protein